VSSRPTFYVDRCVGKQVVQALRDAGARVEAHDDHFAQNETDESWIPDVANRGWVILTKDKNIRRRAGEREAVVTASAKIITLTSGNMTGAEMAATFVTHLADMESLVANQPAPFVAILGPGGMQAVLPKSGGSGEGTATDITPPPPPDPASPPNDPPAA
jgi:predicted nuclease of predicted toxin-antitoxin system